MSKDNIVDLAQRLIDSGLAQRAQLIGYDGDEVRDIESAAGVTLPLRYKEFLITMGKHAGRFSKGTELVIKDKRRFPELRAMAERLLRTKGLAATLLSDAFVFANHQGYQFWYFRVSPNSLDPPVYYFHEGSKQPVQQYDTFTGFLSEMIDAAVEMEDWLKKLKKRESEKGGGEKGLGVD